MTSSTARANAARQQPVSVAIVTPVYGALALGYVTSLIASLDQLPRQGVETYWIHVSGNSLIGLARSQLAALFLASSATHLMSIDGDLEWEPADILRLLKHDLPFVAGCYRQKNHTGKFEAVPLPGAVPCRARARGWLKSLTLAPASR
jgi:hypothetical protein